MSDITRAKAASGLEHASLRVRLRHLDLSLLLFFAVGLVLAALVLNPLVRLVLIGFASDQPGGWTLGNYLTAYTNPQHLKALGNSVMLGIAVSSLCVVFAVPIAWGISRTNMPLKNLVRAMVLGAFVTPDYLGAVGWMLLAGPNAGWLNRAAVALTGADHGPFNIFSFPGLVFVVSLYSFPYIFVFATAAFELVSSELEDAAAILGAGMLRTTMKVTLPMVLPAVLGGVVITFLESIALFGAPTLIAVPAHINVVTTQLWIFFQDPSRIGVAAAYAMPLLLITVALFWWQQRLIGRRGFVSLTGKGGERRLMALGAYRWVLLGYAFFVVGLAIVLPYLALAQAAFAKAWGRGFSLTNLTLHNFKYVLFDYQMASQSIVHSIAYAGAAASLALGLAFLVAYAAVRRLLPLARVLSFLCVAPFVIPGIVLAIGFYAAYTTPPLQLYDTALILILAFTTRFLPIAYVSSEAAVRSLNPEMEDAVRILGGGRVTAVRRVVAPLLKSGLIGAWLLVFIPATRELSSAIFLYGPNTQTMSIVLFYMNDEGNFEYMAALGLLLLGATIAIVAIGYRFVGRDFMLRRSG
ncbi:MAG TPA: iron ABC transporter permease [Stellaceae bacterium]|nr:iron ABC transporter permease [Stellaceae bacterium]